MKYLILSIFVISFCSSLAQNNDRTQVVLGRVLDANSKFGLPGVTVLVLDSDPMLGAVTDAEGYFRIENVPLGRANLQFSFMGYKRAYLNNLMIKIGKETVVEVYLEESVEVMEAVVIKAYKDRAESEVSELATVSARGFNIEETQRYAGAFNDPARMASNFAGVSAVNDGRNDIIIRGNSPTGLLWRLEGLDIPNPNHYAATGGTGGPVTILNNNQLSNSEFYTGAFPAMYSNATSGVFDLSLRNGNYEKFENTLQIGFNGFELGSEGPINRKNKSSYMINYRYSVPAVIEELGMDSGTGTAVPYYQDLSFKVNFPSKNGNFKIFGLGGLSKIDLLGSETTGEEAQGDMYGDFNLDIYNESNTGILGVSYLRFLDPNTFWRNAVVVSGSEFIAEIDTVTRNSNLEVLDKQDWVVDDFMQGKMAYTSEFNKKISARNTINAGLTTEWQFMDLDRTIQFAPSADDYNGINTNGRAFLLKSYVTAQYKFNDKLLLNYGLNYLYYDLNSHSTSWEPRIGIKYQLSLNQKLSLAYGRHSQTQVLPVYFNETRLDDGTTLETNKSLALTKSDHIVLGYEIFPTSDFRIRSEIYYQKIKNVPVSRRKGHFSMLNEGHEFSFTDEDSLYNDGTGRNVGLELTVEKFLSNGWYALLTGSFFDSKYAGSDGVTRNSIYNGNIVTNALAGKEWTIGNKGNILSIDLRLTYAGNKRYIPIDLEASIDEGRQILSDQDIYVNRLPYYFRSDVKVTYRKQGKKVTEEYVLDVLNVTDRNNVMNKAYSEAAREVYNVSQTGLWPMFTYRLLF